MRRLLASMPNLLWLQVFRPFQVKIKKDLSCGILHTVTLRLLETLKRRMRRAFSQSKMQVDLDAQDWGQVTRRPVGNVQGEP